MEYRADLHCHSTFSDGSYSPIGLLELAKEVGLSAISITDHDTLAAYSDSLFAAARELGITLFTGVEFSAQYQGKTSIHVLGYNVQRTEEIETFCLRHVNRRFERNRAILRNLSRLSFPIAEEELYEIEEGTVVGRPHIAEIMVKKGYVSTSSEAFNRFLGEGQCCYASGPVITIEETIRAIHQAGGKAFLAHPHFIRNKRFLHSLSSFPFDGFECYYALLSPDKEKTWVERALREGKLMSGGSDFHGASKPHLFLGCSWTCKEDVEKIFGVQ